jgi:hypothetical protein
MKFRYIKTLLLCSGLLVIGSCKKMLDINKNPDALPDSNIPIAQLLTSAQVNLGFEAGSDLFRYSTEIMQQMSGEASSANQTYFYYLYNITGSDQNNVWSSIFSSTLNDLELIIKQATAGGSPYYSGIAKILKAYEYSLVVDTWGDVPYTEAQQLTANTSPHYDDDAAIYPKLITLLSDGITDLNAGSSILTPGTNSVIYPGTFSTVKANWIKFANTLRLRLLLHYSKKDPTFTVAQITALVNTAGISFMASNADNFQMAFYNVANQRNSISQFEVSRPNYLFADARMLALMNAKSDPRRPFYFTDFPFGSGTYVGVSATAPPPTANNNYSRVHTFLRGAVTAGTVPPFTYTGAAPQRMLSFAEYNFIRAEAALMGAPGDPQAFFTAGITASMTEAGVSAGNITTYLAANGTLIGTNAQKLQQIIEEKYIALFGVSVEPWTDWRRTGYPALSIPVNAQTGVTAVPRTLFYPQSEIDLNPNHPPQKNANLQDKVFWDN